MEREEMLPRDTGRGVPSWLWPVLLIAGPVVGLGLALLGHSVWPAIGAVVLLFLLAIRGFLAHRRRSYGQP